MNLTAIMAWMVNHPELTAFVILTLIYFARSIMPRQPNPKWPTWMLAVWKVEQRILMLPWDRWFGRPKLPGAAGAEFRADEAPTRPDTKTIPPKKD